MHDRNLVFQDGEYSTGRRVIYTPYLSASMVKDIDNFDVNLIIDESNIVDILNDMFKIHLMNEKEIIKLSNYYLGKQPILDRVKVVRPDINNKTVMNYAYSITRQINGYAFGKPVVYAQRTQGKDEVIQVLNDMMEEIDKHSIDLSCGENRSIYGTSFISCLPSVSVVGADENIPFNIQELDATNTMVAYYTGNSDVPVIAVTYYLSKFANNECYYIKAYTKDNIYTFRTAAIKNSLFTINAKDLIASKPNILGEIPIIEYPNNKWRIGDWEVAMAIFNAINNLVSDNVNDVQQFVSSILVLINAELPENEEIDPLTNESVTVVDYTSVAKGILSLINEQGYNTDAKYISKQLDSSSIKTLSSLLKEAYAIICGIPDRKTNNNTGGDTGEAVSKRDGWDDMDILANSKESWYKKSEKRLLKLILKILSIDNYEIDDLSIDDISIKFNRNKSDNLTMKANFISTMVGTNKFDIQDVIELAAITTDSKSMAERGEAYQKAHAQETQETKVSKVDENIKVSETKD